MELLFTIFLSGLTWFNYKYYRRLMAPAVLFSFIWTVVLGLHQLFSVTLLDKLYPLSFTSLLFFSIGAVAFSVGSLVCNLFFNKKNHPGIPVLDLSATFPPFSFIIRLILVLTCAIILPFFVQKAIELFIQSQLDSFFMGLRVELTYGEGEGFGVLKYIVNFATVAFGICQVEAIRFPTWRNKSLAIISFLLAAVYALFFTGRTFFLFLAVLYIGIQQIYNPKFRLSKFLWIIPLTVVLFTVYGLMFGKGGDLDESFSRNLNSSSQNTALYFVGSLSAFDWEISHHFQVAYNGHNSFRFFYLMASAIGLIDPVQFDVNVIQEYVFIPYETNVFTVYSCYNRDFGFVYPMLVLFFMGLLHTWLYMKAKETGSLRYSIYYSILLYPLIMTFFQDQYFTLFSTWFQVVLIFEGIVFLNKFFVKKSYLHTSALLPAIEFGT